MMSSMFSRRLLFFASAMVALVSAGTAHAWTRQFAQCNGSDVKWRGDVNLHRNSFSIADGSHANSAFWNGIWQWTSYSSVLQSDDVYTNPTSDRSFDRATNGENEVSLASRALLDGMDGRTFFSIGVCGFGANDIDEADVVIANDMQFWPGWGADLGRSSGNYGRTSFVHEMGHFFGFGHSTWAWTQMHNPGMGTLTGGWEPAATFADDIMGMRSFYGSTSLANIMASSTQIRNGSVAPMSDAGTFTVCRNSQQTFRFYLGNAGPTATGFFSGRIRMSPVSPTNGGYTQSTTRTLSFSQSLGAFMESTTTFIFSVPQSLPNGDYFVYIDLDPAGAVPESRENDNFTLSAKVLRLTSAC